MKHLAVITLLLIAHTSFSQDSIRYEYCQLVGSLKNISMNVKVEAEFAANSVIPIGKRSAKEVNDYLSGVANLPEAMNYMAVDGWEFCSAYAVTNGTFTRYFWILRRRND